MKKERKKLKEREQRIWDCAFAAAFSVEFMNGYKGEKDFTNENAVGALARSAADFALKQYLLRSHLRN